MKWEEMEDDDNRPNYFICGDWLIIPVSNSDFPWALKRHSKIVSNFKELSIAKEVARLIEEG